MQDDAAAIDIIDFWWQAGPAKWFAKDGDFDRQIVERFGGLHAKAAAGELAHWEETPHGALALVILLDQFSRNMLRDDPRAFAQDPLALEIAERAIARGFDKVLPLIDRRFFYLPHEHSEDITVQHRCCDLMRGTQDQECIHYALIHLEIISRFGRFPHRNAILGRENTPEEEAFLEAGGFSG